MKSPLCTSGSSRKGKLGHGRTLIFLRASSYVPSIIALRDAGFVAATMDRTPTAPGDGYARACVLTDLSHESSLAAGVSSHGARAITPGTKARAFAAARVSKQSGLDGIGTEVAKNCLDKCRMRHSWRVAGLRHPDFLPVLEFDDLRTALDRFGLPAVLKLASSWESQGVSVLLDHDDLATALLDASAHAGPHGFIVERFVPGTLPTGDRFVFDQRVDIVMLGDVDTDTRSRSSVNLSLNYPTALPGRLVNEAQILISRAVTTLSLKFSVFHCECIVGPQ